MVLCFFFCFFLLVSRVHDLPRDLDQAPATTMERHPVPHTFQATDRRSRERAPATFDGGRLRENRLSLSGINYFMKSSALCQGPRLA
ncbi:hypothetical protein BDV24DRAFT_132236 [Aspergillus arachidicola]|uniref:Secreted protein n=1 Tax=Aspergillus arachidicola TaxID=656916 RepID=A0A5N6Y744_9EURO|nr:hypothetical protein BDV24DRAFT_132236 [Aspergillus arachidicola]